MNTPTIPTVQNGISKILSNLPAGEWKISRNESTGRIQLYIVKPNGGGACQIAIIWGTREYPAFQVAANLIALRKVSRSLLSENAQLRTRIEELEQQLEYLQTGGNV